MDSFSSPSGESCEKWSNDDWWCFGRDNTFWPAKDVAGSLLSCTRLGYNGRLPSVIPGVCLLKPFYSKCYISLFLALFRVEGSCRFQGRILFLSTGLVEHLSFQWFWSNKWFLFIKYCVKMMLKFTFYDILYSFFRENQQLLRQRYYYATWKADGTRYMMLITWDACYLIDRRFHFRRVQMRFPCRFSNKVCVHFHICHVECVFLRCEVFL